MENKDQPAVEILTWKDVRNEVLAVNKALADIIDEISPDSSYKLIRAKYKYGDLIVSNGVAQLPDVNEELLPLTSPDIDKLIKKELSYRTMPLMLFLDKSSEVFIKNGTRIIPLNLFHKGRITGVYEAMDFIMGLPSNYSWNFSAGSRSIFMLPKITDTSSLKRVCSEYNIPISSLHLKNQADHWALFKLVAGNKAFAENKSHWQSQIIYFGEKWLLGDENSPAWRKFKHYVMYDCWQQAQFVIQKAKFNFSWGKYAEAVSARRLKPEPYLFDQLKHILSIANGDYPAFRPAVNTEEVAPIYNLQKVFVDIYRLRDYFPTIMYALPLSDLLQNQSVYYSLSLPTLLEGSPLKKSSSTVLVDLGQMKLLIETLETYFKNNAEQDKIINQTKFDYYHIEKDAAGEINTSNQIVIDDGQFSPDNSFPNREFCSTSLFFRGCVKITPNKEAA
jgi:hypothetical protein